MRLDVTDEEAIEEWRTASHALEALVHVADYVGLGALVAIEDAQRRAEIACALARSPYIRAY
jgi:alpha/beta superfamily hydrolase